MAGNRSVAPRGKNIAGTALIATALCIAGATAAHGRVLLTCRDSDNLYDAPYTVSIDANNRLLIIDRKDAGPGIDAGRRSYRIDSVDRRGDVFVVHARGGFFNGRINVIVADRKMVEYTDAFTDRAMSTDYCR